jgi:hypothetical protein
MPAGPETSEPAGSERLEAEISRLRAERDELRRLLTEAEQLLAELPQLRARSAELDKLSSSAEWRIATALRVPQERVEGMWLPAARRRVKQLLARLIRSFRAS